MAYERASWAHQSHRLEATPGQLLFRGICSRLAFGMWGSMWDWMTENNACCFSTLCKEFQGWTDPGPISRPCAMGPAMFERGGRPLGLSYLEALMERKSLEDSLLPPTQPYFKTEKLLPNQYSWRVQCYQCIKPPECIYSLKSKYSLYLPNRCDYLLWLALEETLSNTLPFTILLNLLKTRHSYWGHAVSCQETTLEKTCSAHLFLSLPTCIPTLGCFADQSSLGYLVYSLPIHSSSAP